jgi:hypothetical protein
MVHFKVLWRIWEKPRKISVLDEIQRGQLLNKSRMRKYMIQFASWFCISYISSVFQCPSSWITRPDYVCCFCCKYNAFFFCFWNIAFPNLSHCLLYIDWLRAGRSRGQSSSLSRVRNVPFSTSSRLAVGSTQPPIQWVPGFFSRG